jgi:hypothetical protein
MFWHTMFWRLYKGPSSLPQSPIRPATPISDVPGIAATFASQEEDVALEAVTSGPNEGATLIITTKPSKHGRRTPTAGPSRPKQPNSPITQQASSESRSDSAGEREAVGLEKEVAISLSQSDVMEMGHVGKSQSHSKEKGRAGKGVKPAWR